MLSLVVSFLLTLRTAAHSRAELKLEVLALQHQLQVLRRNRPRRVRLARTDRWFWVVLARLWTGWRSAIVIVKPETVIAWHRQGFRLCWAWLGNSILPNTDVRLNEPLDGFPSRIVIWERGKRPLECCGVKNEA